jgi:hypothetical protein
MYIDKLIVHNLCLQFILCGAFGIVAAQRRETWTIVTHLVVATLGTVFACILLALCAWGLHREYQLSLPDDGGYHLVRYLRIMLRSLQDECSLLYDLYPSY